MVAKQQSPHFGFTRTSLLPQEEMLELSKKQAKLVIGIPKEVKRFESRVALTPESVELMVQNGHELYIESGAGEAANYSDTDYSECGGVIVEAREKIFQCDIVLKVAPLTLEDIELLRGNQIVLSALHFTSQTESYIRKLMQKRMTAVAFETLKDADNCYPVIRSMSEIAGIASVLIAAEYLSNVNQGKGVLLGGVSGITPAEVVILGAGTAAESAARAALGLGANIKIFDDAIARLKRIQINLGQRVYTSVFHPKVLEKDLISADVVIGAVHHGDRGPRYFITEEMVQKMKEGSVIVDLSIDQGGCVETSKCTSHVDPVFVKHGVTHYCIPNVPSRVARTASIALSNVFTPLLMEIAEAGGFKKILREHMGLRHGVYLYNGLLTSRQIGKHFGIPSKDIDLLMAAF